MQFELIRIIIALIGTMLGAYTDYKTGLIFDKITIPMIAIGIILNLFEGQKAILYFSIAGIVFGIGYLLYYFGKIGGGDVKLFAGIALLLPEFGKEIFVFNAIIFASIASIIILSIYYIYKYAKTGIDWKENKNGTRKAVLLGIMLIAYFSIMASFQAIPSQFYFTLIPLLVFGLPFIALENGIRKKFFVKKILIGKAEEEEILAVEYLNEKQKKEIQNAIGKRIVLEKKELEKLKKAKIKQLLVYRALPKFGPFILIGIILALLIPLGIAII